MPVASNYRRNPARNQKLIVDDAVDVVDVVDVVDAVDAVDVVDTVDVDDTGDFNGCSGQTLKKGYSKYVRFEKVEMN